MWKRIVTLFIARTVEFYRDRSALGWNLLFPLLIIVGFSAIFGRGAELSYKVGVVEAERNGPQREQPLEKSPFLIPIPLDSLETGLDKLRHLQLDLVVRPATGQYWLNPGSERSQLAERVLAADNRPPRGWQRQTVEGREISYLEWLFPGVLGMNMMFSALYGVGYVVVRYRKNGVLKRLNVTPVHPAEFLTAQILSRMFVLLATTILVFVGCTLLYGFETRGSYVDLLVIFALGGFCLVSLGLIVAARSRSEEFTDGILNLIAWPMMFLSEVWFSLEGSQPWVQKVAMVFPLTYVVDGARRIMNDGDGLFSLRLHVLVLTAMSVVFLALGSWLFKWQGD